MLFFFYVILAPFALVIRWLTDPLAIKASAPAGMALKEEEEGSVIERALRQF